ncbi:MAG TPA: hypothetical protein VFO49_01115, partial [Nocardioides sp.]|nr:hypothetical protein [Nocardioides sp.]
GFGAFYPEAGWADWLILAFVLVAVVSYVAQVRPALVLGETHLTLRNMLETVHVPWAAVGEVLVQQITTVEAGGRIYDCPAVGRSPRQIKRDSALPVDHHPTEDSFGLFVESQILHRARDARAQEGIEEGSAEQQAAADGVRVSKAWPEIVLLVGTVAALVVAIVT